MNKAIFAPIKHFAYVPFFSAEGVGILDVLIWIPIWIVGLGILYLLSRLNDWIKSDNEKKDKGNEKK